MDEPLGQDAPLQKRLDFLRRQMHRADTAGGTAGVQVLAALERFAMRPPPPAQFDSFDEFISFRTVHAGAE